jgi:hypothetical protein
MSPQLASRALEFKLGATERFATKLVTSWLVLVVGSAILDAGICHTDCGISDEGIGISANLSVTHSEFCNSLRELPKMVVHWEGLCLRCLLKLVYGYFEGCCEAPAVVGCKALKEELRCFRGPCSGDSSLLDTRYNLVSWICNAIDSSTLDPKLEAYWSRLLVSFCCFGDEGWMQLGVHIERHNRHCVLLVHF